MSATFDLISSEYKWTDDVIMDLTLARVCQIRDSILFRKDKDFHSRIRLLEWQTKTLAGFIAATVPKDPKKKAHLSDNVEGISVLGGKKKTSITKMQNANKPQGWDDPAVYVEQGSQTADNSIETFNRLLSGGI